MKNSFFPILFFLSLSATAQIRKDEEMPKIISPVKSITNLKGWAKNNIGKWYEFNTPFNSLETNSQILRIEFTTIGYEGKQYICVVGFTKHFYIKYNKKYIEYGAFFWLLDSTKKQDLTESDTTVITRLFQNFIISNLLSYYKPVQWNDVLIRMKQCFIGTYANEADSASNETRIRYNKLYDIKNPPGIDESHDPYRNFFIKYRLDSKQNKVQFFIGTLQDDHLSEATDSNGKSYNKFDFTEGLLFYTCYDKEKNRNLNCRYFEVPKNVFYNCFKTILK